MRLLIIRPGALGDSLLSLPVLQAMQRHFQYVHITFVSHKAALPLAQHFGIAEETFSYDDRLWGELFASSGIKSPRLRLLLSQIDLAVCWLRDSIGIVQQNLLQAGVKKVIIAPGRPAHGEPLHVARYLAQTVGLQLDIDQPLLEHSQISASTLQSKAPAARQATTRFVIHPGSGGTEKRWPAPSFVSIIQKLWHYHVPITLLFGPADRETRQEILALLPDQTSETPWQELVERPLLEIAQHLSASRGYLGNDAGITHLSALLGVPTLVLFGPSDPVLWRPVGPHVHVLRCHDLHNLSITNVISTIETLFLQMT